MSDIVNPYIAGNPITGTEMFFGREDIFTFVRQTLIGQHRDNVVVLYGQRRTGKTSILYQMHHQLDGRYLCIFIDLHSFALMGVAGFLWELANHIARVLRRDYQISLPRLNKFEFMTDPRSSFEGEFLNLVWSACGDRHLLLMVDEAVRLLEQVHVGALEHEVFEYMRHLMQHYERLNFLFALGSGLEEMEKEYSFLFSVGLYKKISFLDHAAASALITQPVKGYYHIEPAAVERLIQITSGHPYFTQLLSHSLFNLWHQGHVTHIEVRHIDEILDEVVERGLAVLKHVWEESTAGEKATMAAMAALSEQNEPIGSEAINRVWIQYGIFIPRGEMARSVQSLTARDIIVGRDPYRFTVSLQSLWVHKYRRLDWVEEEISDAFPTVISTHNLSAITANAALASLSAPTVSSLDPPSYVEAQNIAPTEHVSPRRGPPRSIFIMLVSLAFIIVAASSAFFLIPLIRSNGVGGSPTLSSEVHAHTTPVRLDASPPYSAMFGFNAQHTRYNPKESTLSTSTVGRLRLGWKAFTSSPIRSSPTVSNGMVYISSTDNNVYAFNASTGAKVWQMPTGSYREPGSFIFSSPTLLNGVLYIGSNDHHVYAFDAVTGKQIWVTAATGGPIYASPAVVNGVLYIGSTDHWVYAYNISNGSLRWKVATGGAIYSSPAVVNQIVYLGSDDFKLYALDAATGHLLWTGAATSNFNTSPSVVDGVVYLGADDSSVYAFQATCSQAVCPPLWVVKTGNYIRSSTAIANGLLYVGSHDKTLYAFDTRQCANVECAPVWKATLGGDIESSPTVANGVVYVGSLDGKLYALDARSGKVLWSYLTGMPIISSPTVLNGMVYVGSLDQNLYAFHL